MLQGLAEEIVQAQCVVSFDKLPVIIGDICSSVQQSLIVPPASFVVRPMPSSSDVLLTCDAASGASKAL
jgi:hypothetical protein